MSWWPDPSRFVPTMTPTAPSWPGTSQLNPTLFQGHPATLDTVQPAALAAGISNVNSDVTATEMSWYEWVAYQEAHGGAAPPGQWTPGGFDANNVMRYVRSDIPTPRETAAVWQQLAPAPSTLGEGPAPPSFGLGAVIAVLVSATLLRGRR